MKMTTSYEQAQERLEKLQCPVCHGSGTYDDAEPGDCSFNTYICKLCKRTGFKNGYTHKLIRNKKK